VTIDHVRQPPVGRGAGGLREIRIPGVHVSELLRPPVVTARALAGTDLSHSALTYLFERTTGDGPFMRNPYGTSTLLDSPLDRGDEEQYIDRLVFAPAARAYGAQAWVYPAVDAPDSALDRIAGMPGPDIFDSSNRFEDQPRYRASSAFDGSPDSAWIGIWGGLDAPQPWLSWTTPRALTLSRLRLTPPVLPVRRPTVVRLSWRGGATAPLPVAADGSVALPRPARARAFRLTVLEAHFPPRASARDRQARAVGIGELSVPGLRPVAVPRGGPLRAACGSVVVGAHVVPLLPAGTIAALDAGQPLRARACAGDVTMGAGVREIRALPGVFSVDLLRLDSPAPVPLPARGGGGIVVDPGHLGNSSVSGVRIALDGPSWLVLGESFDSGWQATCDGRPLGSPHPIDGYANGWLAPASCTRVAFSFGPQAGVRASYLISALTCFALLLFLLVGALLRRGHLAQLVPQRLLPDVPTKPVPLPRAVAIALVMSVPIGLIFALRAGAVSFPLLAFILWRGYAPRVLVTIAAVLLGIVVPLLYLVVGARNQGGYAFAYSTDLLSAHWVGVAAVLLLGVAAWKTMAAARWARRRPGRPSPPSSRERAVTAERLVPAGRSEHALAEQVLEGAGGRQADAHHPVASRAISR
jgi:arabinofuranan 3-O-arabinosyltransferase